MTITGKDLGKKYGRHWIFRRVNAEISSGSITAITGSNGSGKSTLLKILAGYLTPTEGTVSHDQKKLDIDSFKPICFSAPYIEMPEEMTFDEFLVFYGTYRPVRFSNKEIAEKATLPLHKRISEFSTGMKQRVQLSTAFYFENDAIFMDEPTSNLDNQGFTWWRSEIEREEKATIIIASNQQKEIEVCINQISLKANQDL